LEILKCFICYKFNENKHVYFYQGNTKLGVSEILIRKVYNKIREKLYLFYFIEYETDDFSEENGP